MSSRAGGGGSGVGERWYDSRPPFIFIFLFSPPSLFCSRCSGDEQHNKLEAGSRGTERKKKRKRELKKSHGRGKKKKREEKEAQDEDAAGRRWRKMVLGGVGGQDAGSGDGMKRTSDERGDPLAVAMDRRFEQRCFHEKEIGEDGGMKGRGRRSRRRGGGLADSTRRSFVMGRDGERSGQPVGMRRKREKTFPREETVVRRVAVFVRLTLRGSDIVGVGWRLFRCLRAPGTCRSFHFWYYA